MMAVLDACAALLGLVVVIGLPLRGWVVHRNLEQRLGVDDREPLRTFRRSAVVKWVLTLLSMGVLIADPDLGIIWFGSWLGMAIPLVLAGIGGVFVVRLRLRPDQEAASELRQLGNTAALLPATSRERRAWVYLSVTAGVTEEVIYRSFLVTYLFVLIPTAGLVGAAVLAGVAFGSVHSYQGWRGVLLTTLIGVLFGILYPWAGLLTLIFVHSLIDLRVLLVPAELVIQARQAAAHRST